MTWLVLCSPDTRGPVEAAVMRGGAAVWEGDYHALSDPLPFQGVVVDHNADKVRFLYAGCFAGRGATVVYVGPKGGSSIAKVQDAARRVGIFRVDSARDFEAFVQDAVAAELTPGSPAAGTDVFDLTRLPPLPITDSRVRCPKCDAVSDLIDCGNTGVDEWVDVWECPDCSHTFDVPHPQPLSNPSEE